MSNLHYTSTPLLIGSIALGGSNPVRLQSMTNTDTLDTTASVAQCIRIIEAGADMVRLTAQGAREAENLALIKKELRKAGFSTPLIADIHFNPAAAETAARVVEKVRINPGNYTDKRASFQNIDLTDSQYNEELERIHSRILPLIDVCREYGTAIRVGINHGSLSDRIMTRYGNTPQGMVQSALEFIRIFRSENFSKLVLSMKSSDTDIMVISTRILVDTMMKEGLSYPVHLGVTEAGEGEDGRIRSAAGIGALLQDGIGDTIRVSLSEDPEKEIPVAKKLAKFFPRDVSSKTAGERSSKFNYTAPQNLPEIFKNINGPLVFADFRSSGTINEDTWQKAGFRKDVSGRFLRTDSSADLVLLNSIPAVRPADIKIAVPYDLWRDNTGIANLFPVISYDMTGISELSEELNIIEISPYRHQVISDRLTSENTIFIFSYQAESERHYLHRLMDELYERGSRHHIVLNPVFFEKEFEDLQIRAAGTLGIYFTDKRISGIMIGNANDLESDLTRLAFSILQCTDKRITRTMYLSCPTCGRTKFNLQETVKKVKAATGHLKGLKIAVMGCIVNGPGEMAGADYGYVGAAPGKVHIYKGMDPVLKNVSEEEAIDELLRLIEKSL